MALSDEAAAELLIEEQRRDQPRPVLMASDVGRLQGKSQKAIQAALNISAVFHAKVLQ